MENFIKVLPLDDHDMVRIARRKSWSPDNEGESDGYFQVEVILPRELANNLTWYHLRALLKPW